MLIWKQAWFCTGELMKQIGRNYARKMEEGCYDTDIKKCISQGNMVA